MRFLFTSLITLLGGTVAIAHNEVPDSIAARELDEIVVQAPRVIRKADMDVFYPSQTAVEYSKNGMQMLRNLMIPTLNVDDFSGTVKSSGQSVQLRINGRVATTEQVQSLLPETIKRVEWIDNPGLRYNGANAVVNFIVTNPDAGGAFMLSGDQALNCAWAPWYASLKFNDGKSQWGLSMNYKLTNKIGCTREYYETFIYPDGQSLTRKETPVGGYMDENRGNFQLDYSYINPDTTVVWVALSGFKQWAIASLFDGVMSLNNGFSDIRLRDYNGVKGFTPSFSAYLEQHFSHNQVIAVDFNASLYNGRALHDYTEKVKDSGDDITNVSTSIRDCNQAYGIEADYIKKWSGSRLTAGASYRANRNKSTYENFSGEVFHQRQDRFYLFGEYFRRMNNVTVTAGIGAQYTSFRFMETDDGRDSWGLRPQLSLTYSRTQRSQFKLNFATWQSAPSLAETNIVPQQIDGFQWRIGNPDLKTSSSYRLTLSYNYNIPRLTGSMGVMAFTSPDAIAPYIEWRGDKLVTSYENSAGLQNIAFFISPQIDVIPDWFFVNGTLQYRAERMRGTGYKHYNHCWSGDVTAMLRHWNFALLVQYRKGQVSLWGESLTWGETFSVLQLNYNYKQCAIGAGVFCPFTKYDKGSRSISRYNINESRTRTDICPMPFIEVSYNIQWGRQKRGASKLVNADAEVDRSTAKGR